jgi:hypothetical protein
MAVWLVKVLQEGMLGLGEALSYSEEPLDEVNLRDPATSILDDNHRIFGRIFCFGPRLVRFYDFRGILSASFCLGLIE